MLFVKQFNVIVYWWACWTVSQKVRHSIPRQKFGLRFLLHLQRFSTCGPQTTGGPQPWPGGLQARPNVYLILK